MKKCLYMFFLSCCLLSNGFAFCKDNQLSRTNPKKTSARFKPAGNRIYLNPAEITIDETGISVIVNGSSFKATQIHHDEKGIYIQCGDLALDTPCQKSKPEDRPKK